MITITQALKSFQDNQFNNVYLLLGKEKFFHDQVINKLSTILFPDLSSRSLNRLILHGSENSLAEIVGASLSYPMLSEKKLVLVKEFNKVKSAESESFLRYLDNPQKSTILVLICEELSKTKLFQKTREQATIIDCKPIPDYKVDNWIRERIKAKKLNASSQAVMMLAEYVGNNLLSIDHEINKILDYKPVSGEISEDDIINVTGMSKEHNVFTFQKALIDKNFKKSYAIGKNLVDAGENLNLIISIIFNFFKKALIMIKNQATSGSISISDFQRKEINRALTRFSVGNLENAIQVLNSMDILIKSTAVSQMAIIQNICYNICKR